MSNPAFTPSHSLLCKLGSIIVHFDEGILTGNKVDIDAAQSLMDDKEVREWIRNMGVLLPLRR
jgi:hypothetical protein